MINSKKIKGRMTELGITQKELAEQMGIAQATVNQKINNIRSMDVEEAEKISSILNIPYKDFAEYFFYQ